MSTHVANSIVALSAKRVALSAKLVALSAKLVARSAKLVALSAKLVALSAKLVQRYVQSEEHICNYRRDSPCVALRVAVEANELVHVGAFPTHRMMLTACMGWTETA